MSADCGVFGVCTISEGDASDTPVLLWPRSAMLTLLPWGYIWYSRDCRKRANSV